MYQLYKLFEFKLNFRKASNHCKSVLEVAQLAYGNKITWLLGLLANCYSVFSKSKSAIPPLFNSPEVLSFTSDRAKLFAKKFSKNSNLDGLGIYLPVIL